MVECFARMKENRSIPRETNQIYNLCRSNQMPNQITKFEPNARALLFLSYHLI